MKKLLCIILSVLVLFSLSACKGEDNPPGNNDTPVTDASSSDEPVTDADSKENRHTLALPYSEKDSLNPYLAKTQINTQLSTLIYDSLYRLDSTYSPIALIAKNGTVDGKYLTVTLQKDIFFTDKSLLSSEDVVYSFNLAKQSSTYSSLLSGFASAVATDTYVVRFELEKTDVYACNCLTFPIIREGDGESAKPKGSGRYYLAGSSLKYNPSHFSGKAPKIKTVSLFDIKDNAAAMGALQIGNIRFFFSDSAETPLDRVSANYKPVILNSLVFLSFNSSDKLLKSSVLRRIISLAVDKDEIAENAYRGYAEKTDTPFNPHWSEVSELKKPESITPLQVTEMLDENGYKYRNNSDLYRRDKKGNELSFTLVTNSDDSSRTEAASYIKSQLGAVGINIEVRELKYEKFLKAVKDRDFDMYLGEIRLCENMALSTFFTKNGSTSCGIKTGGACAAEYEKLLKGTASVPDFVDLFNTEMPFVPLCYRSGMAAISNELKDNVELNSNDLFANIYEWQFDSQHE